MPLFTGLITGFRNLGIRRKMLFLILFTILSALGFATVIFYLNDLDTYERDDEEHRRFIARIIGTNARATLHAGNQSSLRESVAALAEDSSVLSAWIFLKNGELLASYERVPGAAAPLTVIRDGRRMLAPGEVSEGVWRQSGRFHGMVTLLPFPADGETVGTVMIVSRPGLVQRRLVPYLEITAMVLIGMSGLFMFVSALSRRIISDPLERLSAIMEGVRTSRNYSLRSDYASNDEIGMLAVGLNRMLQEIESHGKQLRHYQEKLADLLAIRTEELLQVKEEAESNAARRGDSAGPDRSRRETGPEHGTGDEAERVRDEHLRLYALMDCIDGEVWFVEAATGMVTANRAAAESLAKDLSRCLNREGLAEGYEIWHFDLQSLKGEGVPVARTMQGASVRGMEVALLSDDVRQRYQLINAEPYRNRRGEVAGTVFVVTDITAQKETEASLRAIAGRLFDEEESLRRYLAAELHDEIGRDLAAVNIFSESIRSSLPDETRTRLDDKLTLVHELISGMSCKVANIIGELRPPLLDDFGLVRSLQALADNVSRRHGIEVDLLVKEGFHGVSGAETAFYRIVQESLVNAAKHSGAKSVMVQLDEDDDGITLVVSDNGCGFDSSQYHGTAKRPSWGLVLMRERAESVGGKLAINSSIGVGTTITVSVRKDSCR